MRFLMRNWLKYAQQCQNGIFEKMCQTTTVPVDCHGAVASVRDSYTDNPSSIPVRLVVASW